MAVVKSRCACCGEMKFVENEKAYQSRMVRGEAAFCQACMDLPDEVAEAMIEALSDEFEGERMMAIMVMMDEAWAIYFSEMEAARQAAT